MGMHTTHAIRQMSQRNTRIWRIQLGIVDYFAYERCVKRMEIKVTWFSVNFHRVY